MFVLQNTNPRSKKYGQICIAHENYGSQYVYYADRKCIFTKVSNFNVIAEVNRGDNFVIDGKILRFEHLITRHVSFMNVQTRLSVYIPCATFIRNYYESVEFG